MSYLVDAFAGGGPAAAHFFCFAKKSEQKKATAQRRPSSRGSQKDGSQNGKRGKLACGSNSPRFFIRFGSRLFGVVESGTSRCAILCIPF